MNRLSTMRCVLTRLILPSAFSLLALCTQAKAADIFDWSYPGATLEQEAVANFDSADFYTGPMSSKFEAGKTTTVVGTVRSALYVATPGRSVFEVFRAYERSAEKALYELKYACSMVDECGGVMPYLYLKAGYSGMPNTQNFSYAVYETNTATGARETIALLVLSRQSSSPELSSPYVFILSATTDAIENELEILSADEIELAVSKFGSASIYGLAFATDEAMLLPSSRAALEQLAAYLSSNEEQTVLLVGHTDSQGSLEYNQDLSRRRANSVRADLISEYQISGNRLRAYGIGYLAPKATNGTVQGRALNRRVEIVVSN